MRNTKEPRSLCSIQVYQIRGDFPWRWMVDSSVSPQKWVLLKSGGKTQQGLSPEATQALSPPLLMSLSTENEQDPQKSSIIHAIYYRQAEKRAIAVRRFNKSACFGLVQRSKKFGSDDDGAFF